MVPWIAFVAAAATAVVGLAARAARKDRRPPRHASIREDLFEGLLPSAMTGRAENSQASPGWGLRWADVTNLTAAELAGPPRRQEARPAGGVAGEEAAVDAVPVAGGTGESMPPERPRDPAAPPAP